MRKLAHLSRSVQAQRCHFQIVPNSPDPNLDIGDLFRWGSRGPVPLPNELYALVTTSNVCWLAIYAKVVTIGGFPWHSMALLKYFGRCFSSIQ